MASAWIEHVKKYYAKMKKKNSSYKYSQALKDSRASYKKQTVATKAKKKKSKK